MFKSNKEFIIFDFDGVIVDSNKIKFDTFYEIWPSQLNKNIISNSIQQGGNRVNIISRIYNSADIFSNSNHSTKSYIDAYSDSVHKKIIKLGVSKGILHFLKATKKTLFINSATPQKELINLCSDLKIDKYFAGIFGTPKSKKENFNFIFENKQIKAHQVVFFGDMKSDKEVAQALKIEFHPIFSKESDLEK